MYSKYDPEKQLMMVGFSKEQLEILIKILCEHVDSCATSIKEANNILTFLEVSRLGLAVSGLKIDS